MLFKYKRSFLGPSWDRAFRYGLSLILLVFEILLYVWYFYADKFTLAQSLPFQLCSLSYILTIIMLLIPNKPLYEFLYFAGIGGAIQAVITPAAILSGFPHFTYLYFFLGHGAIIWAACYMTWVHGYRPSFASIWRVMLMLNGLMLFIVPLNIATGGNYLFLARKPAGQTLLNILGPWPWYIISLEIAALVFFFILYLPFISKSRFNKAD
jgi:hypothetical integral membrane protein (TIGR02206 family)